MPVHALESDCGCGVLAVQATEDPELEVGVHGDRHNCHKYVDRRLLYITVDRKSAVLLFGILDQQHQAPEDPEPEVGAHGDRHNCHKYVDRRLLRRISQQSSAMTLCFTITSIICSESSCG